MRQTDSNSNDKDERDMVDDSNANIPPATDVECKGLFPEFRPATYEDWYREAVASLKGAPFEKKVITKTYEEIDLQPMYWAKDVEDLPQMDSLPGFPGYVRGTTFGGYVLKPWDICQEIACSTPEEFNEAARHDLARGQNALKLVLDRCSRRGMDSDQDESAPVGRDGLSLSTLDDLNVALRGIDLQVVPLTIDAGAVALPIAAMVSACLDHYGTTSSVLRGCIGADPLGELAIEGTLPISLKTAYDSMACLAKWAKEHAPRLQTILVRGCPYHDAGGSAVQEIAYALATGVEYLREMGKRGLQPDEVAPQIRFFFSLGSNFFMEIARLRAARLLWAQIVQAFGGSDSAQKMTIHARTSAYTKTVTDPYVNMLRNTTEAFSGAMGGVDSMHVCSFDEAIRPPDEFSRRVSRNLQIILQQEAHLVHPIDAPGGSWYIEKLADAVARKAWSLFQTIEAKGGMAQALRETVPQSATTATAAKRAKNLDTRKDVLVGTNMYPNLKEVRLQAPFVDYDALRKDRFSRLQAHRLTTDLFLFHDRLGEFAIEFKNGSKDILRKAKDAIHVGATLGDLWAVLSNVEDHAPSIQPLRIHRVSERFEALRRRAEEILAEKGVRPRVFLASVGPLASFKPRADFSRTFFEVGGFEVLGNDAFENVETAAQAALASGARIVAICSTDPAYPEVIPPLAGTLKQEASEIMVLVAGKPASEHEQTYRAAGVDHFFYVGVNCHALLSALQERS